MQFGSALTRLYRFLRNERFDNWLLTEQMLRLMAPPAGRLLLALDWTAWQDRFSVLTAAVCTGTRSVPVAVSACHKLSLARSQNLWEETFLRLTVDRLRAAGVAAVWLCDRGFHRVAWLEKFVEFEQQFVVRLTRDVTVRLPDRVCLLRSLALEPGERRDFGWVWLRRTSWSGCGSSGCGRRAPKRRGGWRRTWGTGSRRWSLITTGGWDRGAVQRR